MKLNPIAQSLQAQGRYGDTTLVHMAPQEVAGLNALGAAYGRPLTINPTTGLPEAFSLKNLLPMIIGTGLNIATGGALTPLQAGMITGAGYTVATGDIKKGIAAGLGAAGGAGIGEGLTAAGATTVPAGTGTGYAGQTVAGNLAQAGKGIKALGTDAGLDAFMGQASTAATPATGVGGLGGLAQSTAMSLAPEISDVMTPKPPPEDISYIRPYSLDITNTSGAPSSGSSAERQQLTYTFKEEEPYRVAQGGAIRYQEGGAVAPTAAPRAAVTDVYQNIANVQGMAGLPMIDVPAFDAYGYDVGSGFGMRKLNELRNMGASNQQIRDIAARAPVVGPRAQSAINEMFPNAYATPAMSYTGRNYGIGLPSPEESSIYTALKSPFKVNIGGEKSPTRMEFNGEFYEKVPNTETFFAEGGVAALRDGRFLRGDGDGMSDEIPASIEGEVDALLSDGEFVIPADVVSHLGNGSSEAGAKVLYEMMDRVRRERTGKEDQAKEVPPEKVLPV